jgi:ATP-dependent Clp protease ATP-binding subunit ClpC
MFERFTDRAKHAVTLAREEAADLGHDAVGTGHLLLGLLGEGGGVAFQALDALGVTAAAASDAVCRRHPAGTRRTEGHLPWTPQFRKTMELALREALQLGCTYVGTEHLLLGLIREGKDTGALALADCGEAEENRGFPAVVRARVLELLRGYADAERKRAAPPEPLITAKDGARVSALFASWAQADGILATATREQVADLARAFMFGYACGTGNAAGEAIGAALTARLAKTAG